MPFDTQTRNLLATMVGNAREALRQDVVAHLRTLAIQQNGLVLDLERVSGLTETARAAGEEFRALLDHFYAAAPGSAEAARRRDAYDRLVREIGFTTLNRLLAIRMAEERRLILISLGEGHLSVGFRMFDRVADGAFGSRSETYRAYVETLYDELGTDLPSLFDRSNPESGYFPSDQCLERLLGLINAPDIVQLWREDEAIGWVYQYYNDPGERDRMRKESTAPRTSRELAVRNQFFTPRYVVEFLADNTLGRTWYEMRQGDTRLRQECRHLIWREGDVFQPFGTTSVPLGDGHHHLIPYRAPKDPRDIRVIDPACGSGHFLLYAFDLFLTIYEEAWNQPDAPPWSASEAGNTLRTDYPAIEDLRRSVPELVIRHNLHGIDIDRRAVQVAGLALWLRAQRAWQDEGVADDKRPPVRRSNLVCAEPMPGDRELLTKYLTRVDPRLQRVAEVIWVAMSRAGDAGSLLPIERILDREIGSGEYLQGLGSNVVAERTFWAGARDTLLKKLRDYAEVAGSEGGTSRRLFAEDAAHGFAYIDLFRERFDVVLMNPPFGKMAKGYEVQARADYPASYNDILGAFVDRFLDRLHPGGLLGAITSRTCFFLSSFGRWRQMALRDRGALTCMVDLGERVMDQATVEAAAYCLRAGGSAVDAPVIRVLTAPDRDMTIGSAVDDLRSRSTNVNTFNVNACTIVGDDGAPLAYWAPTPTADDLARLLRLEPTVADVRQGMATGSNARFTRAWWEVAPEGAEPWRRRWPWFVLGGGSQPWVAPLTTVVNWSTQGMEAVATGRGNGRPSVHLYFRPGLSWTRRAVRLVPYVIPAGCIPSVSRYMAFPNTGREFEAVGVLGTNVASAVARFPGEKFAWPNFLVETVRELPWPDLSPDLQARLALRVETEVRARRQAYQRHEPFHDFTAPAGLMPAIVGNPLAYDPRSLLGDALDREVAHAYRLDDAAYDVLVADLLEAVAFNQRGRGSGPTDGIDRSANVPDDGDGDGDGDDGDDNAALRQVMATGPRADAEALVSYAVGVAFGRWDVRIGADPSLAPALGGPFEALPPCPPGMLVGPDGLPATRDSIASEEWLRARRVATILPAADDVAVPAVNAGAYPVDVAWDGILVSDETDPQGTFDLTGRVRAAILAACSGNVAAADDRIAAACDALGVDALRDYLHRPSGFFEAHVARYTTKGRPPAPIYWPLVAVRGRYVVWVYYHRLTDQTLFSIVNDHVIPRLATINVDIVAVGSSLDGSTGAERARHVDRLSELETLRAELEVFISDLQGVVNNPFQPSLDDGTVVTASPLARFFPRGKWRTATEASWEKLERGDFDWAHLAMSMWPVRVRAKCVSDRSLSIAHGLTDAGVTQVPDPLGGGPIPSHGRRRGRPSGPSLRPGR